MCRKRVFACFLICCLFCASFVFVGKESEASDDAASSDEDVIRIGVCLDESTDFNSYVLWLWVR